MLVSCASAPNMPSQKTSFADSINTAAPLVSYNAINHPVIANSGMVVSQNAVATRVGQEILAQGGNAVDAAVATGFALAVTLPRAGNIGGSGFMMVHMADASETLALDFRSAAPAAFDLDAHRKPDGTIDYDTLAFGAKGAGVPGTVAGFYEAWSRYGSLEWQALVEPAIKLAREGIIVSEDLAFALKAAKHVFELFPASEQVYLRTDGSTYKAGDSIIQADLAWSLEQIAKEGADALYRGELSKRFISGIQHGGGTMSRSDLADYRVKDRGVLKTNYRGFEVMAMPPASGGGLALIQMLKVLGHFELGNIPQGSAESLHIIAEAMKRGAANRRQGIGDTDFVHVQIEGYLSDELARSLAEQIDLARATPVKQISPAETGKYESRETTHFSIMDKFGNAVANTYTLGYSFGSGYVVPGTGILLDNQIRNFSLRDETHANAIAPGKRMISTMTPTIVLDDEGEVYVITGTPGGGRIINVILQVLVNVIDYDMNIAEATVTPRIHQPWRSKFLSIEPGINQDTTALLKAKGHIVKTQKTMGSTQSIMYKDGYYFGAADPRRPGSLALGVQTEER